MLYWLTDGLRREHDRGGAARRSSSTSARSSTRRTRPSRPPRAARAATAPEGEGGEIPNDPDGRSAPSLRSSTLADKLRVNPNYVRLAVSYGGVVVSGNVNSPMPAWSAEVGGPLNEQQIEAVVTLIEGWARGRGAAGRGRGHGRGRRSRSTPRSAAPAATAPTSAAASGRRSRTSATRSANLPVGGLAAGPVPRRLRGGPADFPREVDPRLGGQLQRRRADRHAAAPGERGEREPAAGPHHLPPVADR